MVARRQRLASISTKYPSLRRQRRRPANQPSTPTCTTSSASRSSAAHKARYGASSMGGTVKLITTPPDLSGTYGSSETTGSWTTSAGANYAQNLMMNLPLVDDHAALRMVATYSHQSGWIDRIIVPNFPAAANGGMTRGNV